MTKLPAIALAATIFSGVAANAQQPVDYLPLFYCGKTADMEETLKNHFKASTAFVGLGSPQHMDRLYINEETGAYTVLRTSAENDISCVIVSGEYGELKQPEPVLDGIEH